VIDVEDGDPEAAWAHDSDIAAQAVALVEGLAREGDPPARVRAIANLAAVIKRRDRGWRPGEVETTAHAQ